MLLDVTFKQLVCEASLAFGLAQGVVMFTLLSLLFTLSCHGSFKTKFQMFTLAFYHLLISM